MPVGSMAGARRLATGSLLTVKPFAELMATDPKVLVVIASFLAALVASKLYGRFGPGS
jgi:hypothetical protein